jgi:hypothetical protein
LRLPEVKPRKRIPLPYPLAISYHNPSLINKGTVALSGFPVPSASAWNSPKTPYTTALEDAQAVRLTSNEAATYLKNVLDVGTNPTVGNFHNTLIGDA